MFKYVGICFKKYCDFSGRARRKEFWYFWLFNFLFDLIFAFIPAAIVYVATEDENLEKIIYYTICGIHNLIVILPTLAVAIRRLHDVNRSGWYMLLYPIPFVNLLTLVNWWACYDSIPGTNKWGENPKEVEEREKNGGA